MGGLQTLTGCLESPLVVLLGFGLDTKIRTLT